MIYYSNIADLHNTHLDEPYEYIVYVTSDQEEFLSEAERDNWEYKINHLPASCHWYDKDGLDITPVGASAIEYTYNSEEFVEWKVDDVDDWFTDLEFCKAYWGFVVPNKPGDWFWDKREGWHNDMD